LVVRYFLTNSSTACPIAIIQEQLWKRSKTEKKYYINHDLWLMDVS
jgi:hypothetical protein